MCKQIDEGIKEGFTETEVIRGVLRIVKPGVFKDMLINKDEITVNELKGFLRSHLGEKASTELFQELMCARQSEQETPQQFLYRMIGLKQKILFQSKQVSTDIRYEPKTIQEVFLHSIYQGPSQHHGPALQEFVEWCDSSKLGLNVSKTKEMVVTFSSRQRDLAASVTSTIHGKPVEVVEEYKYLVTDVKLLYVTLGTIFDNLLKFSANTEEILRRCHQRLYLLGKLNFFGVSTPIMMTFYYAFLESIMTFSITCWFHSLSLQNRNRLQHTASVCSKIIGLPVRTLAQAFSQQALRQAAKIISDPSHILHPTFQ
ncbi:hypothetical protein ACER0C_003513 [Sarotherodon galilaeus]